MTRRAAVVVLVGGLLPGIAHAQAPGPSGTPPTDPTVTTPAATAPETTTPAVRQRGYRDPLPTDPSDPNYHAGAYHSIVRHNPVPNRSGQRSAVANSDGYTSPGQARDYPATRSGGVFSTGGAGINAEYYDSRTLEAPPNAHQVPVARFDSGGGPDRAEQIAARQAGTQRSQAIQSTINTFGTPYAAFGAGYGYGLGLGGGRLYAFPY